MKKTNAFIGILFLTLSIIVCSLLLDNLFIRAGIIIVLILGLNAFFYQFHNKCLNEIKVYSEKIEEEKKAYLVYLQKEFDTYWEKHKSDLVHTEQTLKAVVTQLLTRNDILPVFSNQLKAVIEQTEGGSFILVISLYEYK